MKCSLADDKSLSARIENLANLGREQLDQAWRDLFASRSNFGQYSRIYQNT